MSKGVLITPAVSLVDEVVRHLRPDGADYSSNLVIFPGKRPAHFLRKALGEIQGKSFIPPVIHSVDTFIDFLSEDQAGAPRRLTAADAAVILFRIHSALQDRIGGAEFSTFERFLPMGLRIFEELEELAMTCQPPERIVPLLHSVSLRGLHSLGTMYERFYPEVEKLGYSTRATRYVAAAGGSGSAIAARFSAIVIAGVFALPEAERRVVQNLAAMNETTVILQDGPGIKQTISDLELVVEERGDKPEEPAIDFLAAPDSHGEVFALADRLQELQHQGMKPDHRSVVVVPDPALLPSLVHHAFSQLDDAYNISIGYPHSRTPIVGFLTSLMKAVSTRHEGKFHAADYLNVVLHPYVKSMPLDDKPHAARLLLFRIEEYVLDGKIPPFFRLEDIEANDEIFKNVALAIADDNISSGRLREHLRALHGEIIRPLTLDGSIGDCARRCIDVLSTIANQSTSRRHTLFRSSMESILSTLGTLCRSLLAEVRLDDNAATFSIVRNCINQGRVALPGTPLHGLQVLGLLETRNLRFDNVYVLNANDDQIPGEPGRYMLIPHMVRRELGLATRNEHDRIAGYYFSLLLSGAQRVTLLYTDNEQKAPSRFVERLLWQSEQAATGLQTVRTADYRVTLTHRTPDAIPKTQEAVDAVKNLEFSATALDRYLKCGIQFYYQYVLRLEEKEEIEDDVDRLGLGFFLHKVLSEFYAPFVGSVLEVGKMETAELERLVDRIFRAEFGEEEFGNRYLLKVQIKRQLSRFLKDFEAKRLNGTETRLLGVEIPVKTGKNGFRFQGRIDRMEEKEGRVSIYDYKTGWDKSRLIVRPHLLDLNDRSGWSKAIGSLQLPFYMFLASEGLGTDVSAIAPSYLLLGKGSLDPAMEVPLFDSPEMGGLLYPKLETVIFELLRELTDVTQPFGPPADLQETCPNCPFTHLCGTEWVKKGYS